MKNKILTIALSIMVFVVEAQTLQSVTDNGSTTSNTISINSGSEGVSLIGNSYLSYRNLSNNERMGYLQHDGSNLVLWADVGNILFNKRIGIGLNNPYNLSGIHVKSLNTSAWTILAEANTSHKVIGIGHTGNEGVIAVSYLEDSGYSPLQFWTSNIPRLTITTDGNLGIGTTTPNEKLSVNGKIRAQEIKVENANWPDYVFGDDYKLPTLQETEQHIKENGHLEGMPSAKEVKANGIDLGEMNAKLLKKIEELTLHLIEQDKEMNELKNEVYKLKGH